MTATEEKPATTPTFDLVATQGLEAESALVLTTAFTPFLVQAADWKAKVATVDHPKVARESRLVLKSIRVEAEKKKRILKEDSLKRGRAIDGMFNTIAGIIEPMEATLLEIEERPAREEAARKNELQRTRQEALAPFGTDTQFIDLREMPAEQFTVLLENAKLAHEAKKAAEAKAEAERIERERIEAEQKAAKEKADREERERIEAENAKLRQEAAEREKAASIEREKAEKAKREAAAKAKREKEAAEAKAKADAEAAAAAAKIEADRLAEIARVEREAREKAEREAQALRDAEAKRIADDLAAKAKAAAAPDKEKLAAWVAQLRALHDAAPDVATASLTTLRDNTKSSLISLICCVEAMLENDV